MSSGIRGIEATSHLAARGCARAAAGDTERLHSGSRSPAVAWTPCRPPLIYASPRRMATRRHAASRRPDEGFDVPFIYTGAARRINRGRQVASVSTIFASQGWPAELQLTGYVYGPTGFVETVSDLSEFLARCPSCESVLLRMVRTFDALWLDMSGMSALRILMMINSTGESYSR